MTFYFAMTNSWSLLYDELYGEDTMPEDKIEITTGVGNTASTVTTDYCVDTTDFEPISIDTTALNDMITNVPESANSEDTIHISTKTDKDTYIYESPDGGKTVTRRGMNSDPLVKEVIHGDYFGDSYPYVDTLNIDTSGYPSAFTAFSDNDDSIAHLIDTPVSSGIEDNSIRKYKEDEAIKALQDYISTTYGGHYTSKENNVQTLCLLYTSPSPRD